MEAPGLVARGLTEALPPFIFPSPFGPDGQEDKDYAMVSSSQQFERIRKRKMTTSGKRNKRERRALGTPAFPIHQPGYDAKAADAKKPAEKA